MAKKPRPEKVRIGVYVERATYEQLVELSQALHVPQSSVVAQALARWHRSEPLVRDLHKQVSNGDGNSAV